MNTNPDRRERIKQHLLAGKSMRQISFLEGVNRSTIGAYAKRLGIRSAVAVNKEAATRRRLIREAAVRRFGHLVVPSTPLLTFEESYALADLAGVPIEVVARVYSGRGRFNERCQVVDAAIRMGLRLPPPKTAANIRRLDVRDAAE